MSLEWFTSPEWANIVKALLHTLWQGAVMAGLLGLALRRLENPVARYRCSLASLAGVLLAGLVTWAVLNRPVVQPETKSSAPAAPPASGLVAENNSAPLVVNFSSPEPKAVELGWTAWLALAWLAGATVMIGRAGFQVAGAERLRRTSRPMEDARILELLAEARRAVGLARRVRLAVTDRLTSPAVVGVLVPTLILPLSLATTLAPEQIRFILLHELAHIRRGDYFASLFQLFVEALLFFNPAVWWISRQMRLEREACCDALAIELSGAPADYARTLVHVAENILSPAPAAAPAFGDERGPSSLADRVQRLLVPGYRPRLRLTWRAMLAALIVGGALLTFSAIGTRMTVAAILSPQQRIAEIEQKMTEYGVQPGAHNYNIYDESASKVKISGHVRTADGTPVPKWFYLNAVTSAGNATSCTFIPTKKGYFAYSIPAGTIYIGAAITNHAPAVFGPLDGFATNRFENLEMVVESGFDVPLQVVDAETGDELAGARVVTMYWMNNIGFPAHTWTPGADGSITLTHCADLPLDVTVNVPGYEITQKRFDHVSTNETLRVALRRGESVSGMVSDKTSGQPVAGAEFRLLYESGRENSGIYHGWDDSLRVLGHSDASGAFTLNQLRQGIRYYLGVSMPGHESVIVKDVTVGTGNLEVQPGPELIVRGHVIGSLDSLSQANHDRVLDASTSEVYENNSYGDSQMVRLHLTNGVATFEFTNRTAGRVTLSGGDFSEERDVTAPIEDWVVNLAEKKKKAALVVATREVIFRFKNASTVPPGGTVVVQIPGNSDVNFPMAHEQEVGITNGEVHVQIAIGGQTSIAPKHLVGYWFDYMAWINLQGAQVCLLNIPVAAGAGPLVIEIPLLSAGAIYAQARNADGTAAGGLLFGASELKRAPDQDANSLLDNSDNISGDAPRHWVSGPLPLGGTYQIHAWRGNSFCIGKPIKLTESNPDAEVELQFPPAKTFAGMMLDRDGKPLADAELKVTFVLQGDNNFGLASVYTDEHGRFELENATPDLGDYSVEADVPGRMAEIIKLDFAAQPQTIRLKPGHTLAGRVVEQGTGYPIPGVQVSVWTDGGKLPMQKAQTDADGHFEFTSLGKAKYTLFVAEGQQVLDNEHLADGTTNLLLTVKLAVWSTVKPKAPAGTGGMTNAAGVIGNPNFNATLHALEQRTGAETSGMPPARTALGSQNSVDAVNHLGSTVPPMTDAIPVQDLIRDAKLFYDMGKLDEAETNLESAIALDFDNADARYYLCLVQQARSTRQRWGNTNELPANAQLMGSLYKIQLEEFGPYKNATLRQVLHDLNQAVIGADPQGKGVNIFSAFPAETNLIQITIPSALQHVMLGEALESVVHGASKSINYQVFSGSIAISDAPKYYSGLYNVDTNTFPASLENKNGLGETSVTAALKKLFGDAGLDLDSSPKRQLFYDGKNGQLTVMVEDKADLEKMEKILFELGVRPQTNAGQRLQATVGQPGDAKQDETNLFNRVFKVDKEAFYSGLKRAGAGLDEKTNSPAAITAGVRKFVTSLGVDLESPAGKAVFYYDRTGMLLIRATRPDLALVDRAVEALNHTDPQIHIKARFVELPTEGFVDPRMGTNHAAGPTGILDRTNAALALRLLQAHKGFEILSEPECITISGRPVKMMATQVTAIITNMAFQEFSIQKVTTNYVGHWQAVLTTNVVLGGQVSPQMSKFESGTIFDVVPSVLSDGENISLTVTATDTEFCGYLGAHKNIFGSFESDWPDHFATNSTGDKITLPELFPVQQVNHATASATVSDGETLVLTLTAEPPASLNQDKRWDGFLAGRIKKMMSKTQKETILVLVTVEIVDETGKRVHADGDKHFAQNDVPAQPGKGVPPLAVKWPGFN